MAQTPRSKQSEKIRIHYLNCHPIRESRPMLYPMNERAPNAMKTFQPRRERHAPPLQETRNARFGAWPVYELTRTHPAGAPSIAFQEFSS